MGSLIAQSLQDSLEALAELDRATAALAARARSGFIDREERAGKGASDHVPVVVDYD